MRTNQNMTGRKLQPSTHSPYIWSINFSPGMLNLLGAVSQHLCTNSERHWFSLALLLRPPCCLRIHRNYSTYPLPLTLVTRIAHRWSFTIVLHWYFQSSLERQLVTYSRIFSPSSAALLFWEWWEMNTCIYSSHSLLILINHASVVLDVSFKQS